MTRTFYGLLGGALVLAGAACTDLTSSNTSDVPAALTPAFSASLLGSDNIQSSYDGGMAGTPFDAGPRMHGGPDGGFGGFLMGGLGADFLGADFFGGPGGGGPGHGHGPFGDHGPFRGGDVGAVNCPFDSGQQRNVCPAVTDHSGLTINRSEQYKTASGTVQSSLDTVTTDYANTKVTVSGTITHRDGDVTKVNNSSDRTVTGLAKGSPKRTVNGTETGNEVTTGKDTTGTFTATRTSSDVTTNVVIPVPTTAGQVTYPTSGTVKRNMSVTVQYTGKTATTSTRSETITYNGTNTAQVVIVQDGTTKNCTIPLPRGHLSCS